MPPASLVRRRYGRAATGHSIKRRWLGGPENRPVFIFWDHCHEHGIVRGALCHVCNTDEALDAQMGRDRYTETTSSNRTRTRPLPAHPRRREPNLLFAAAHWLAGIPDSYADLRTVVLERGAELTELMLAQRTQTNEPARCATLLPVLAALPQPLALLEVGASAGLTLLPDRYSYDYAGRTLTAADPAAPVLHCQPRGPVPLPAELPHIVWRAGIDLNPLDVTDPDDVAWLRCLIWPGEPDRQKRLDAAIAIARRDPPHIVRGDLVDDLSTLAAQAPTHAILVVFHSAVLVYWLLHGSARREGRGRRRLVSPACTTMIFSTRETRSRRRPLQHKNLTARRLRIVSIRADLSAHLPPGGSADRGQAEHAH